MLRLLDIQPMYGHVYMVTLDRNGTILHRELSWEPQPDQPPIEDYPIWLADDLLDYLAPPPSDELPRGAPVISPLRAIIQNVARVAGGRAIELPIVLDERSWPAGDTAADVETEEPDDAHVVTGLAWPVLDEVVDPTVPAQLDSAAAGPACAHMVLQSRGFEVPPAELVLRARARMHPALTYRLVHVDTLLRLVQAIDPEGGWIGGALPRHHLRGRPPEQLLEELGEKGPWIAQVGRHFVVVDRFDSQTGHLSIRDPWYQPGRARGTDAGTRSRVSLATFFDAWAAVAIYRDEPCCDYWT